MKKFLLIFLSFALLSCSLSNQKTQEVDMQTLIDEAINISVEQYLYMASLLEDSVLPKTINKKDTSLITSGIGWWCSGFYPGSLWYLYEATQNEEIKKIAIEKTELLEDLQYNTGTHDLGFMLYCSYGNAWRLTQKDDYKKVLLNGAKSLSTRYNPVTGCIKSWDFDGDKGWQFPVIIDNMMNLEYLFWAAKEAGNSTFYNICLSHADKTIKNHFREDNSSWHVVDYDTITGKVRQKCTHQGYADESAWSRGQTWGLYGFTVMYRETRDNKYLEQANAIADFILNHPNLPGDYIPYWDFNAPNIPDEPRDASAAAIMASALLELSGYVDERKQQTYLEAAKKILVSLSGPEYRAEKGENAGFILRHSVGSIPHNSEIDVPLTYADYYYIEALLRLRHM
jgi:unsaturated chondroitin disaccharide hydrolase